MPWFYLYFFTHNLFNFYALIWIIIIPLMLFGALHTYLLFIQLSFIFSVIAFFVDNYSLTIIVLSLVIIIIWVYIINLSICFVLCRIMLFIVVLPVVQTIIFYYAIGHDPSGLKLAVSNHEMTEEMIYQQSCPVFVTTYQKGPGGGGYSDGDASCNQTMLSCRYLDMLKHNKSMILVRVLLYFMIF